MTKQQRENDVFTSATRRVQPLRACTEPRKGELASVSQRTGRDKPVHMVVCVSSPPVLFPPFLVTVINELRDVITQPPLCTPTPIESAASYLVSRMFLLCDLKEAVLCPFLCGRQQMEGAV